MNLREAARGRPCTYRAPGCDGGGDTTVLAHIRRAGSAGVGQKPCDYIGFWACVRCHDLFDGRRNACEHTREELDLWAFDAMVRTLTQLYREGEIT